MKQKLHAFFANPLVIIVPLVLVLNFGWQHYLHDSQHFSLPVHNMLPNANFTSSGESSMPEGWQLAVNGNMHTAVSRSAGYITGRNLHVNISSYKNGDANVLSPIVNVTGNNSYLYEGYYRSSGPFDILLERYYDDGASTLTYVQHYGATSSSYWSTVSAAFKPDPGLKAVQIVYRLTANGNIQLNGNYLEPRSNDVYVANDAVTGQNLLAGFGFDTTAKNPKDWAPFSSGGKTVQFSYLPIAGQDSYTHIAVQNNQNGEAKWEHPYLTVHGGQQFRFSYFYRSNTTTHIVAEYVMSNGRRQFQTLATVSPNAYWTIVEHTLEVPADAQQMTVGPVLTSNGYIDGRGYALYDTSKPGAPLFKKPLVSIAFEDGWAATYKNGVPIMQAAKLKGTFYVSPLALDTNSFMTTNDLLKLRGLGNEIGASSNRLARLNTISDSQIKYQLRTIGGYVQNDLNLSSADFATSAGENNPVVRDVIQNYYTSNLSTDNGMNTRQNFDRYNLQTFLVGNNTTVDQLEQALASAKAQNAWLIITYPKIQGGKGQDQVSPDHLKAQLDAVKQNNVPVVTVNAALHQLRPQL